ncbi:MAG: hypothetical protein Q8R55_03705 [Candidatus Taylorbacteria bacterium]|nr:hypothetical protein [Candidatus Taylorbacteria bacterium]
MSISLRDRWSNSVLHLSAYIAQKKNGLLVVHGIKSFLNVLLIIGAEILLLIVSLPSYIVARPVGDNTNTKEYRLRRTLTLGVIGTLFIIWVLKLVLILVLLGYSQTSTTTVTETYNRGGNTETMADDVLIAKESMDLSPPAVTKIQNIRGKIAFWGTAPANSVVVFAFIPLEAARARSVPLPLTGFTEDGENSTDKTITPKIYTTQADANGRFELWEDTSVFNLPKGNYTGSVSAYDPVREIKSGQSQTFSFKVTESFWNKLLYSTDTILNILALLVVIVWILVTILVT